MGERIRQSLRALIWASGLVSGIFALTAIVLTYAFSIPQAIPSWVSVFNVPLLTIFFSIASLMWLSSYQVGAFLNGKYLPMKKRISFHFLALVSSFAIGFLECATPLIALVRKPKTFDVIKKRPVNY